MSAELAPDISSLGIWSGRTFDVLYSSTEYEGISHSASARNSLRKPTRSEVPQNEAISCETLSSHFNEALRLLQEFARLAAGWDSYGACPITEVSIQTAQSLLLQLQRGHDTMQVSLEPDSVVPLSEGGVQLEWSGPRGEIEVEVGAAGELSFLVIEGKEPERKFYEAEDRALPDVALHIRRVLGF